MGVGKRLRLVALVALGAALATAAPASGAIHVLTGDFARFADATSAMPAAERIAAFRARFGRLFPAFYRPRDGRTSADYDAMIARALADYPAQRLQFAAIQQEFGAVYARETARFASAFPGFRQDAPVYLLHSLGEMDAGTKMVRGRRMLIFGADGIARYVPADGLGPLLDHELFHLAHARWFPGCFAVWCTLWREGLAVYATKLLNPASDDRQLGLQEPDMLRPAVEMHRRDAYCLLRDRLAATTRADRRLFFLSGRGKGPLPPRFGYYLGFRIAERAGRTRSLTDLMRLPPARAHALLTEQLAAFVDEAGGCDPPAPAVVATAQ